MIERRVFHWFHVGLVGSAGLWSPPDEQTAVRRGSKADRIRDDPLGSEFLIFGWYDR
jgi:hypothetical protein